MPQDNPAFGEIWSTSVSGRTMVGVVCSTNPVTVVSLTGNRMSLGERSFLSTWNYEREARSSISCIYLGCSRPGVLVYPRNGRLEYVCPIHVPAGVQSELTGSHAPRTQGVIMGHVCPSCAHENGAVENLAESIWHCPLCSTRFVPVSISETIPGVMTYTNRIRDLIRDIERRYGVGPRTMFVCPSLGDHITREAVQLGERESDAMSIGGCPVSVTRSVRDLFVYATLPRAATAQRTAPIASSRLIQSTASDMVPLMIGNSRLAPGDGALVPAEDGPTTASIKVGSHWQQRGSGRIVTVSRILGSDLDPNSAIHFGSEGNSMVQVASDFRRYFIPLTLRHDPPPAPPLTPKCKVGEEWEDERGIVYRVAYVESTRCRIIPAGREAIEGIWLTGNDFNLRFKILERRTGWEALIGDDD